MLLTKDPATPVLFILLVAGVVILVAINRPLQLTGYAVALLGTYGVFARQTQHVTCRV